MVELCTNIDSELELTSDSSDISTDVHLLRAMMKSLTHNVGLSGSSRLLFSLYLPHLLTAIYHSELDYSI